MRTYRLQPLPARLSLRCTHVSDTDCWPQAVDHALSAGADRFSHNDIERVTGLQTALRLKPAEVQVPTSQHQLHQSHGLPHVDAVWQLHWVAENLAGPISVCPPS